jgi:hypothetical protein
VQNGALPPLPELRFFIWAYYVNYSVDDMPSLAARVLPYLALRLSRKRDYLRYLFEVRNVSEPCDCLTLARIWPISLSPQSDKLREIDRAGDHWSSYVDYICDNCRTKWRLEEGSDEDGTSYNWVLLEVDEDRVNLFEHDKYGKALAESRSQVGLTIGTLRKVLDETLPIISTDSENYRTILRSLAESGIVDLGSLQNLIATYLSRALVNWEQTKSSEPRSQRQLIGEILSLFIEKEAEKWLTN